MILHPPQKNIQRLSGNLKINDKQLKIELCIRYLGIIIDSNLTWKEHVACVVKKIRRSVRILSKIRYQIIYITDRSLYYALIYSFIIMA